MNYDLCDILNQKMENLFKYKTNQSQSIFKNSKIFDSMIEKDFPDIFLNILSTENNLDVKFAHWIYRNGKISDQILDFDQAARKIMREISNMTFSNFPSIDIMYFSGVIKMLYCENNFIYLETASKPSLDQLMSIKDFQKSINCPDENIFWKVCVKRNRNLFEQGIGLNELFKFNFLRIK